MCDFFSSSVLLESLLRGKQQQRPNVSQYKCLTGFITVFSSAVIAIESTSSRLLEKGFSHINCLLILVVYFSTITNESLVVKE